jgi:hypothetical protein
MFSIQYRVKLFLFSVGDLETMSGWSNQRSLQKLTLCDNEAADFERCCVQIRQHGKQRSEPAFFRCCPALGPTM